MSRGLPKLPQHPEAESLLLGSVFHAMVDPATVAGLAVETFTVPLYQRVLRTMQALIAAGDPINLITVTELMELDPAELASVTRLPDALNRVPRRQDVQWCIDRIEMAARERELIRTCNAIVENNGHERARLIATLPQLVERAEFRKSTDVLGSCSVAELLLARERQVDWLVWPLFAPGLSSIVDALPKIGKTVLLLRAIYASRFGKPFLSRPTKPMRVVYVSEQSKPSLAMQMREIGFDGSEPIEEVRVVTREYWSKFVFPDFVWTLEKDILQPGSYNAVALDTFHTIARLDDENDSSEVNRLGNLLLDVACRNNLALVLGRHDRKSGGEVGLSGRGAVQLSGLIDVIAHLMRGDSPTERKLELAGRAPGLPARAQRIELMASGEYLLWGDSNHEAIREAAELNDVLTVEPTLSLRAIEKRTGIPKDRVSKIAKTCGWSKNEKSGVWQKGKPS